MTGAGKGRNASAMSDGSELSNLVSSGGAGIQGVDTTEVGGQSYFCHSGSSHSRPASCTLTHTPPLV
jgi:hypothetical protein